MRKLLFALALLGFVASVNAGTAFGDEKKKGEKKACCAKKEGKACAGKDHAKSCHGDKKEEKKAE